MKTIQDDVGGQSPESDRWKNILVELQERPQWVCWRLTERGGKKTKIPYCPKTGKPASSTDPKTWTDFGTAVRASKRYSGIGYVFSKNDPYTGVDFDHVYDPEVLEMIIAPWAHGAVDSLNSYTELTQSGKGLHIILKGRKLDKWGCKKPMGNGTEVEVYDQNRFFVMTGDHFPGTPKTVEGR